MKEQISAVEWLVGKIQQANPTFKFDALIREAKAMEKQQMHKCASFWRGKENEIEKPIFEQYYNETFKSE